MDKNNNQKDVIASIDIGDSKILVCIGVLENDKIKVVGISEEKLSVKPHSDLSFLKEAIINAVKNAEMMSGQDIKELYLGIADEYIHTLTVSGTTTIDPNKKEVTQAHVESIIHSATTIPQTAGVILHKFPAHYTLDGVTGIKNPIGMCGVQLKADLKIIVYRELDLERHRKKVESAGFDVNDTVLETLASSYAILDEEEKELGVTIIDIGAASSDIAVFKNDSVYFTASFNHAGDIVTKDITKSFNPVISIARAEKLKIEHGTVALSNILEDEEIYVPGIGGQGDVPCSKKHLAKVMHSRLREILTIIAYRLEKSGFFDMMGAGVVLTGGTANTEGIVELAREIFRKPVRLGCPKGDLGLGNSIENPSFSVGIGLLYYAEKYRKKRKKEEGIQEITKHLKKVFSKITELIKNVF
ncbi:MAG: cell division protein FtsA [Fibrobacter sp.]|nr:cell division protein FtsA [Fibrobacter sp.]